MTASNIKGDKLINRKITQNNFQRERDVSFQGTLQNPKEIRMQKRTPPESLLSAHKSLTYSPWVKGIDDQNP